jgi:fatty acid desaturase
VTPLPELLQARRRAARRTWIIGLAWGTAWGFFLILAAFWGGWSLAVGLLLLIAFAALVAFCVEAVRECARW